MSAEHKVTVDEVGSALRALLEDMTYVDLDSSSPGQTYDDFPSLKGTGCDFCAVVDKLTEELNKVLTSPMPEPILQFRGQYHCLSNFYKTPVEYLGFTFPSAENAYQAGKCKHEYDRETFVDLTPAEAKAYGREIHPRENWGEARLVVMEEVLRAKFSRPLMKKLLLSTGERELVESNTWGDKFWGVCDGEGSNHLGKLLMKLREVYRKESVPDLMEALKRSLGTEK